LLIQVNQILGNLMRTGQMKEMAEKAGVSYSPPTKPYIQSRLTMKDILSVH
jgi:hypothetical protein